MCVSVCARVLLSPSPPSLSLSLSPISHSPISVSPSPRLCLPLSVSVCLCLSLSQLTPLSCCRHPGPCTRETSLHTVASLCSPPHHRVAACVTCSHRRHRHHRRHPLLCCWWCTRCSLRARCCSPFAHCCREWHSWHHPLESSSCRCCRCCCYHHRIASASASASASACQRWCGSQCTQHSHTHRRRHHRHIASYGTKGTPWPAPGLASPESLCPHRHHNLWKWWPLQLLCCTLSNQACLTQLRWVCTCSLALSRCSSCPRDAACREAPLRP